MRIIVFLHFGQRGVLIFPENTGAQEKIHGVVLSKVSFFVPQSGHSHKTIRRGGVMIDFIGTTPEVPRLHFEVLFENCRFFHSHH